MCRFPNILTALSFVLLGFSISAAEESGPDLSKIDRTIQKEPAYQGKPGYLLLVFGPKAEHKAWLVLDGNTLYVDRYGTGDLTHPECRVEGKDSFRSFETLFEAGDLRLGSQHLAKLTLYTIPAKQLTGRVEEEQFIKQFVKSNPEATVVTVGVEVPYEKLVPDPQDKNPTQLIHRSAGPIDSQGLLQFAGRPEDASIVYFGSIYKFVPLGHQKLVRGRTGDLTLNLGTHGSGPGTFARVSYVNLIPDSAKPLVRIEYPVASASEPLVKEYILKDRCCYTLFYGGVLVPEEVALGEAKVTVSMDSWSEGRVVANTFSLPVVSRPPLPSVSVSPQQQHVIQANGKSIEQLRYTPDGKTLIAVMSKRTEKGRHYEFHLCDVNTHMLRCRFFELAPEDNTILYSPFLVISPNGNLLALHYNLLRRQKQGDTYQSEETGQLHIFDLTTGKQLWHHEDKGWGIYSATFSSDGGTLVTCNTLCLKETKGRNIMQQFRGQIRFWDALTGQRKSDLPGGPYHVLWHVRYSPDEKYIMFVNDERNDNPKSYLIIRDLLNQKDVLTIPDVSSLPVFATDNMRITVSSNVWTGRGEDYRKAVGVYEITSGKQIASLPLPEGQGWLHRPVWSHDDKYILVCSSVGEVWRWDPSGSEPLQVRKVGFSPVVGNETSVYVSGFLTNRKAGLFLLTLNGVLPERVSKRHLPEDYDELPPPEIVLWDVNTMERKATLTGHRGQINTVTCSPDGKTLVSGGSDGTIRFWDLTSDDKK